MTVFKTFEVNFDSVSIDDQLLYKPEYISVTQWYEFWAFVEEANLGDSVQDKVHSEVDQILEQTEYEHEMELNKALNEQATLINERLQGLINSVREYADKIEDEIISAKVNDR